MTESPFVTAVDMTYHQLVTRTVATLRKGLAQGRRGAVVITSARARFYREMHPLGFDAADAYRAFHDCCDLAELENLAWPAP